MRSFCIGAVLLLVAALSVPAWSAPMQVQIGPDARNVSREQPAPTQVDANYGYLTGMATPTGTVGTSAAVLMPTLPAGAKLIAIIATNGAINFGGSDVQTGAGLEDYIASGSARYWDGIATTTMAIYLRGTTGTASYRIRPIGVPQ